MNPKRQKIDSLAAMAAANPASAAELQAKIGDVQLKRALQRAMALGRTPSVPIPVGDRAAAELGEFEGLRAVGVRSTNRPIRRLVTIGLGVAAIAVLAALFVVGGWLSGAGNGRPEFAAAAIRVAEANPRLLVTAPGWKIVRADEFEPDSGELTFSDGSHHFDLHWYPARLYGEYLSDRATESTPEHGTLLGQRATTIDYQREEYATMLSPQGSVFIELRGQLGSRGAYDQILQSLKPVDVQTWLSAMPPSTVRPEARSEAVDQILRGVPVPPGFDPTALQSEDSISDQSSLATKVGNAVACGWVESWIAARAAGDQAAAQRAFEAVRGSANWPIVRKTKIPWFSNYQRVANQMHAGQLNNSIAGYPEINGKTYAIGPVWKLMLGCKDYYRREVDGLPNTP